MSSSEKPRLTAGVGKARRWRSFPPGGARFPCAFGAAGETCKECLRLGAQTPRPPGGAGRYDFTWRAAALQTSDGWCGREARRRSVPGGTCRVSCPRLLNHSRFPDGRAHGFAAPLRVALGLRPKCPQGTRFPSRLSGARNARAASVRRKDGLCHSERRAGMGPARKRAATKRIPRTAWTAPSRRGTCEATFFRETVDKAKRWCYHSSHQRRRRQSRYESSAHGLQLRLFLYLWLYVYA